MTTDLSKFKNDAYRPGSKLKIWTWYIINSLFFINPLNPSSKIKTGLLRLFGAKVGRGVIIKPRVNIKYPWLLAIGNHVWIGEKVWIDNLAKVTIKDHVCVSQGALLLCGNHNYKKVTFDLIVGEINLEEGAWVGAKSIVCPGVTLMSHSVLAAGAVATKDLEPYAIYQGNPAIKVKTRKVES